MGSKDKNSNTRKTAKGRPKSSKRTLEKVWKSISIYDYLDYRSLLSEIFMKVDEELNGYSHRQYSQDSGLSYSTTLYLVTTGQRKLSIPAANNIVNSLDIPTLKKEYFTTMVKYNNCAKHDQKRELLTELEKLRTKVMEKDIPEIMREAALLSKWYYPVVIELVGLFENGVHEEGLLQCLHVPLNQKELRQCLELLLHHNYISLNQEGLYFATRKQIKPSSKSVLQMQRNYYSEMAKLSLDFLRSMPVDDGDFNSLSLSITQSQLTKAKQMFSEFCQSLMSMDATSNEPEVVVQVNVNLMKLGVKKATKG